MQGYSVRPRRKDKDGFSTFSSDSGNVHDYMENSDHAFGMVKSKSMPEYEDRFVRAPSGRRYVSIYYCEKYRCVLLRDVFCH